jgi:hypothetical protein
MLAVFQSSVLPSYQMLDGKNSSVEQNEFKRRLDCPVFLLARETRLDKSP